jgi:hypothetical protein
MSIVDYYQAVYLGLIPSAEYLLKYSRNVIENSPNLILAAALYSRNPLMWDWVVGLFDPIFLKKIFQKPDEFGYSEKLFFTQ